jgi:ATP-dependent Clp protease ATP-binding subunit ClpX
MLDIMYEIPKDNNIGTVVITGDYIKKTGAPVIQMRGMEIPALTQQNG